MRFVRGLLAPLAVVTLAVPVSAADLDSSTRAEVIEEAIALLEELYVIPETVEHVAGMLRENLASGKYDDEVSASAFAAAITRDMQDLTKDKHLRLSWGDDGEQPTPGGGSDGGVFGGVKGIPEAKMLPGNVGYVDIRIFVPLEMQKDDAVQAMATVADADAIIFDLRMCMGGTPEMVHFITSYLYSSEPMHLLTYYHGHTEPDSAFTLAEVPGRRRPDVDVWILTSEITGSGCEEFTYNLKHHERATVVGRTTGGAGHGGGVHALSAGFSIFVPDFRPVHPKTGTGWEVVGVVPHVECDPEKGLPFTHKLALEKILKRDLEEEYRSELALIVAGLNAELARADPDSWTLKRIPQAKIKFVRGEDGKIRELHVLGMQGTWEVSRRQ